LNGGRVDTDHIGCLSQFLCSLELAVGMDDLGPSLPLRLRLPCNCPAHLFRQIDLLRLDQGDFDSPRLGVFVENVLKLMLIFSR